MNTFFLFGGGAQNWPYCENSYVFHSFLVQICTRCWRGWGQIQPVLLWRAANAHLWYIWEPFTLVIPHVTCKQSLIFKGPGPNWADYFFLYWSSTLDGNSIEAHKLPATWFRGFSTEITKTVLSFINNTLEWLFSKFWEKGEKSLYYKNEIIAKRKWQKKVLVQ